MTSLYLHIPFCKKKCAYCSFYSVNSDYKEEYIDALIRAVIKFGGKTLKSVYVGGGTPSVLSPAQITRIFDAVRTHNTITDGAEITVEVNPESVTDGFLSALKSSGVNRISMGFQSFDDSELKTIGRLHDADTAKQAVALCKAHGFYSISGDIIFGLPHQTAESLKRTVQTVLSLDIPHISAYNLQLESGTPVTRLSHLVPDEDTQAQMYHLICDMLKSAGFAHYEISNFAKDGYRAVHNSVYWQGGDYIGIGPSAHSKIDNTRYYFDADIQKFINGDLEFDGGEEIADPLFEKIMLGLRTDSGVDMSYLSHSGAFIDSLVRGGFATITDGRLILTDKGFYLSNTIIAEITAKEC